MKVIPLAFDSMGVRSMATLVETGDTRILIDPGVALGKVRSGFRPHPIEIKEKEKRWQTVREQAEVCDILVVTHYHYDHHNPAEPGVYAGKVVFLKDPANNINYSQRMRAKEFIRRIKPVAKKVEIADGNELRLRGTEVKFSSPLPHGTDTRLGYIIMVNINERGERFLHTSDVEGPSLPEQERMICEYHPDILLCDGPMTHMLGNQYPESALRSSETNLVNIVTECGTETLILDHHFLRDIEWRKRMPELFKICETRGTGVMTAAEFAGEKNNLLEANRAQLYARYPVSREATFKNPHDQQDGE